MSIVLHQFLYSHYNEKVRWALNYKKIAHERISYLPGPHMGALKKLSGRTATPVLVMDGKVTAGSTEILRQLEQHYPEQPLFPADEEGKAASEKVIKQFDEVVGPASRALLFSILINHGNYLTGMFATGKPAVKRLLYRMTFPLVKGLMAKANGVNEDNVARSKVIIDDALMQVAEATSATGYMIGDKFSAADLCAASLLAPLANPSHPDMARPQPMPQEFTEFLQQYGDHAAMKWVQEMYSQHR